MIFPEGTTNKTQELLPFKPGAVKMAQRAGVPIVPMAVSGPYTFWSRPKVHFGRPLYIKPDEDLIEANARLIAAIQRLRDEQGGRAIYQYDGKFQDMMKPILLTLIRLVYRPKVSGRQNIPRSGPTIVIANHKHDLDPFLIMSGRRRRRHHFIAKRECVKWKIGKGIGAFGVIFVDRAAKDKSEMKETVLDFLRRGRVVALFPEGTRNKTAEIVMPFHLGAASFAQKSGALVVPAAIVGEYKWRGGLEIAFGKPVRVKPTDDIVQVTAKLQKRIEKMLIDRGERQYRPRIYQHYQTKAKKEATHDKKG
jgi:1-acyl-sn-glycerol-3-phosphate acyltransferase